MWWVLNFYVNFHTLEVCLRWDWCSWCCHWMRWHSIEFFLWCIPTVHIWASIHWTAVEVFPKNQLIFIPHVIHVAHHLHYNNSHKTAQSCCSQTFQIRKYLWKNCSVKKWNFNEIPRIPKKVVEGTCWMFLVSFSFTLSTSHSNSVLYSSLQSASRESLFHVNQWINDK